MIYALLSISTALQSIAVATAYNSDDPFDGPWIFVFVGSFIWTCAAAVRTLKD